MIETVTAKCDLDPRHWSLPNDLWRVGRSQTSGCGYWQATSLPEGMGAVRVYDTPADERRVAVEANLTTLLHGKDRKWGSLREEEVGPAIARLLGTAEEVLGRTLPPAARWEVHRLDPSRTYAVPQGSSPTEVVLRAHRAFSRTANSRQVRALYNDQTVTYRHSKARAWSVYDKTAEDWGRGGTSTAPAGLVRLEARLRPRKLTGKRFEGWRPSLALTEQDRGRVVAESDELEEALVMANAGGVLAPFIVQLRRGGVSPERAVKLAAVAVLLETGGPAFLTDVAGFSRPTVYRLRSQLRDAMTAGQEGLDQGAESARILGYFVAAKRDGLSPAEVEK